MLMQSDTCPACGQVHADSRLAALVPRARQCPLVVTGTLPTLNLPKSERGVQGILSVEMFGEAAPAAPPLPDVPIPRKPSALAVPWPMPSQLEDYL